MIRPGRSKNLQAVPYYLDIRRALGEPGCAFCRLVAQSADRYLDTVLWEMVTDPDARSEINRARGYCHQHGWLLVRVGAALGVAIISHGVLDTLLKEIGSFPGENGPEGASKSWLRGLERGRPGKSTEKLVSDLAPQTPCPVCVQQETLEKQLAETLLAHLDEPGALAKVYRESDGLCLEHFRLTLTFARKASTARTLVAAQRSIWERLHAELAEFIRKKDFRFKDELFGSEKDAWRRTLEAISGPPPRTGSEWDSLMQSRRRE
jgi:hypothetical protein